MQGCSKETNTFSCLWHNACFYPYSSFQLPVNCFQITENICILKIFAQARLGDEPKWMLAGLNSYLNCSFQVSGEYLPIFNSEQLAQYFPGWSFHSILCVEEHSKVLFYYYKKKKKTFYYINNNNSYCLAFCNIGKTCFYLHKTCLHPVQPQH